MHLLDQLDFDGKNCNPYKRLVGLGIDHRFPVVPFHIDFLVYKENQCFDNNLPQFDEDHLDRLLVDNERQIQKHWNGYRYPEDVDKTWWALFVFFWPNPAKLKQVKPLCWW